MSSARRSATALGIGRRHPARRCLEVRSLLESRKVGYFLLPYLPHILPHTCGGLICNMLTQVATSQIRKMQHGQGCKFDLQHVATATWCALPAPEHATAMRSLTDLVFLCPGQRISRNQAGGQFNGTSGRACFNHMYQFQCCFLTHFTMGDMNRCQSR